MSYKLGKVMSESLVGLDHPEYGRQLWTRCKVRKYWECEVSGRKIHPSDNAWRPVTNGYNRMHRISNYGMAWLDEINEAA